MVNSYRNKSVFITGNTGFKGSWLSLWLSKIGANVVGYSASLVGNISHFELLKLDMKTYFDDIKYLGNLKKAIKKTKPEIVFHLAAQPLVRYSYKNPIETFETNIMGTANLLEACKGVDSIKAIVIVTTDKCYENKEWHHGYRENDRLGGYDPYSASKAGAEIITSSYRDSFFNLKDYQKTHQTLIATVRAGNVMGGGDWSEDRLIPDIIRATIKNKTTIIRNPNATRPWQHVLELLY
ncbi:MAG: CDP-glucose 4,6-dehydratase, partial [Campylobacterales bacterium]